MPGPANGRRIWLARVCRYPSPLKRANLLVEQEEAVGLVRDLEDGAADRARLQSEADAAIRVARELKSALEESNTAAEHLQTELALAQVNTVAFTLHKSIAAKCVSQCKTQIGSTV